MRAPHVSSGERVVLCTKKECAFVGDMLAEELVKGMGFPLGQYYVCEAEIIVLDRSARTGKTCGRFAKKCGGRGDSTHEPG